MIKGIAHVCFVTPQLDALAAFYTEKLGLEPAFDFVENGERRGVYLHAGGRSFIELFAGKVGPSPDEPAFRHFCLEVDDIEKALADLREKGLQLIDEMPHTGPEGEKFAFIHPKSTHGVLIELYEYPQSATAHK